MEEAVAKFNRFQNLVKTLPGLPATYLVAFSAMDLPGFLENIRLTWNNKKAEGALETVNKSDVALLILARIEVAIDKIPIADLHRFTQYVEYFMTIAGI